MTLSLKVTELSIKRAEQAGWLYATDWKEKHCNYITNKALSILNCSVSATNLEVEFNFRLYAERKPISVARERYEVIRLCAGD